MLALSSRPWLGYSAMGRYNLTPLSYEALDYAAGLRPTRPPPRSEARLNGRAKLHAQSCTD